MFETWKWRSRIEQLQLLLDEERTLLLNGDLQRLSRTEPQRKRAEDALGDMPASVADTQLDGLIKLRNTATRNRRLMDAYLSGARAAAERVKAIEGFTEELGAYTREGARISSPATRSKTQTRA